MKLLKASLLLLALAALPVAAQVTSVEDRVFLSSEAFLSGHPDLKFRLEGLAAYEDGKYEVARVAFQRAARYSDKPSQSVLGEMHWLGKGIPADRAMGYVWMDLAAERGYPLMIAKREHYWRAMTEQERARALEVGAGMYEEYGDAVAKPRLSRKLALARRNTTGSRTGFVGNLVIQIPTPSGTRQVQGSDYYDRKFWEPERYYQWQDQDWKQAKGSVEVGDLLDADDAAPPAGDDRD